MRVIDIDQAATAVDRGAAFVDVREHVEFRQGHVPGAINIPVAELTDRMVDLDRNRPVHVVCASGNRSAAVTSLLDAAGFEAVNVAGGTGAWVSSGRPIEK